jgi:hypothetical protein
MDRTWTLFAPILAKSAEDVVGGDPLARQRVDLYEAVVVIIWSTICLKYASRIYSALYSAKSAKDLH